MLNFYLCPPTFHKGLMPNNKVQAENVDERGEVKQNVCFVFCYFLFNGVPDHDPITLETKLANKFKERLKLKLEKP
ncbi:hypothetical protein AAZV13_10G090300 [Glycine max]